MTKQRNAAPWHPCDDCLDPLIAELTPAIMDRGDYGLPSPVEIEGAYVAHRVPFLFIWMQAEISVEFAREFEEAIVGPVQEAREFIYRLMQFVDPGHMAFRLVNSAGRSQNIGDWFNELMEPEIVAKTLGPGFSANPVDDDLMQFIEPYFHVREELSSLWWRLRNTSAILRARLEGRAVERNEVPDDMIDMATVAKLVHLEATSLRTFRREWPKPDIAGRGRSPAKWFYQRLLPVLKRAVSRHFLPVTLAGVKFLCALVGACLHNLSVRARRLSICA